MDSGNTWTELTVPTTENIEELYFYDNMLGFIGCKNGVILKTSDGGNNWTQVLNNDPDKGHIISFEFVSSTVGFAGSFDGIILKTTDGGDTWNVNYDITTNQHVPLGAINCIDFPNNQVGYAGTGFTFFAKTTNAGGVVNPPVAVEEFGQFSNPIIYPNPATNQIQIKGIEHTSSNTVVSIKSMNGAIIKEGTLMNPDENLDIRDIPSGLYVVEVRNNSGVTVHRFTKL